MRIVSGMGGVPKEPRRKMRNHYAEDHKFAQFFIIAYLYKGTIILFSEMTSVLRLNKS